MNRRDFIAVGAAGALGLLGESRMAGAQTPAAPAVPYGASRLGISDDDRDGTLYIPKSYQPGVPMPLMMMLHGFAGSGEGVRGMFPLAEEFGVVMIAPARGYCPANLRIAVRIGASLATSHSLFRVCTLSATP